MKKFVYIASIMMLLSFTAAHAQDDTIPTITQTMRTHMYVEYPEYMPEVLIPKIEVKELKKFKGETYKISSVNPATNTITWIDYKPRIGEKVLYVKGKYFYSVTQGQLLSKVSDAPKQKRQKVPRTQEQKMQTQQVITQVVSTGVSIARSRGILRF